MKSWLNDRRARNQQPAALSPAQPINFSKPQNRRDASTSAQPGFRDKSSDGAKKSGTSSRVPIERYLNAPIADEAASPPAISAALRERIAARGTGPRVSSDQSRENSTDNPSEGRRTIFTARSRANTMDTSYTGEAGHDRKEAKTTSPVLHSRPSTATHDLRPATAAGFEDTERDTKPPGYAEITRADSPHNDHVNIRMKAVRELASIEQRARIMESSKRSQQAAQAPDEPPRPRISDEEALKLMAKNPKLARMFGQQVKQEHTLGSVSLPSSPVSERPTTAYKALVPSESLSLHRSKSNSTLADANRAAAIVAARNNDRRLRWYCTFCRKAFNSRAEWMHHEESVHTPEELWVCCPDTGVLPRSCPFCDNVNPSRDHLADHNYFTCQGKPLSNRTFERSDRFLQHVSQMHRIPQTQKPAILKALNDAWRTPSSIGEGHPALHCGFCGANFGTYHERTAHVGDHFAEGKDMSSWWADRINHTLQPLAKPVEDHHAEFPHQCDYCERTFDNLACARKFHPTCTMWSCSFLPSMRYAIYPVRTPSRLRVRCCYCNDDLAQETEGRINSTVLRKHLKSHDFRACHQKLYFSAQSFRQHLQDDHRSSHDLSLFAGWTLLVNACRSEKPSIFRHIEGEKLPSRRGKFGCSKKNKKDMDADENDMPAMPSNFMDLTDIPLRPEPNRLRRKSSSLSTTSKVPREPALVNDVLTRAATLEVERKARKDNASRIEAKTYPAFYRRRLDASTRNRIYTCDAERELVGETEQVFRKLPASALGVLIMRGSLLATVPARMTNSVDVYLLPQAQEE